MALHEHPKGVAVTASRLLKGSIIAIIHPAVSLDCAGWLALVDCQENYEGIDAGREPSDRAEAWSYPKETAGRTRGGVVPAVFLKRPLPALAGGKQWRGYR
jgi:hypothetical protein